MDEADGKELAELIGWILGEEWRVYWGGAGVTVEPASASKRMLKDCPCLRHFLASRPDAAFICELIDEAVLRREDVSRIAIEKLRIGDCRYKITIDNSRTLIGPTGYQKRPIDARLATLRLLRQADDG